MRTKELGWRILAAVLALPLLTGSCTDRAGLAGDATGPHDAAASEAAGESAPTGCVGAQPAIEECFRGGGFYADCGGTGAPRLACNQAGDDCRWFSGGCVPRGYVASDCPAEEICCHEGGGRSNGWPFPDCGFSPIGAEGSMALFSRLWCYGTLPWDRDRAMALSVVVSPELVPAPFDCTGTPPSPYDSLCLDNRPWTGGLHLHEDTLLGRVSTDNGHYDFWFEVDPNAAGGPAARVCAAFCTDAVSCDCPEKPGLTACATSGQVTLSAIPETEADLAGLRFAIEATFDNGMVLSGGFSW